jgi:type IV pilus biogenesis protein CpaD/CtpE
MRSIDFVILAAAAMGLAGCYGDPFQNPANWSASNASQKNLNAQVANKADLISGHGNPYGNGIAASAAIDKALGQPAGTAAGLQTPPPALSSVGSAGS